MFPVHREIPRVRIPLLSGGIGSRIKSCFSKEIAGGGLLVLRIIFLPTGLF